MSEREPLRVQTCVVLRCATCGEGTGDDFQPEHFPDADAARKHTENPDVFAWDWTDPERPVCASCAVQAVCARDGHLWSAWWKPVAGDEHRYCCRIRGDYGACNVIEYRDGAA